METLTLPHLESHPLVLGLYTNVTSASFLRQQLLAGNTDFEYAFLDASVLLSRSHVLASCFRAINAMRDGKLASRNVHSEIVFNLSRDNNIADSFRRFGVQDSTASLIAIKVLAPSQTPETTISHLEANIQGTLLPFTDAGLTGISDLPRIRKVYKLDPLPKDGSSESEIAKWRSEGESAVLGMVALKGS